MTKKHRARKIGLNKTGLVFSYTFPPNKKKSNNKKIFTDVIFKFLSRLMGNKSNFGLYITTIIVNKNSRVFISHTNCIEVGIDAHS